MGFGGAVTLGLGSLLGAGLYVLIGLGVAASGPSLWLACLICGLLALPSALMYSDLSRHIPLSGGGYLYAYQELGSFWGFMVGWLLAVDSVFACALYAIGLSAYLVAFFPDSWSSGPSTVTGVAMGAIVLLAALGLRGGEGGHAHARDLDLGQRSGAPSAVNHRALCGRAQQPHTALPKGLSGVGSAIALIYISFFEGPRTPLHHGARHAPRTRWRDRRPTWAAARASILI